MNVKKEFLWIFVFIAVFVFSFFIVCYLLQYDVLTGHDFVLAYKRRFLEPEHGRYFSTFFASIFSYSLPEFFNIAPNDFQSCYMPVIKAFCITVTCLFVTNLFFVFSKNEDDLLVPPIHNPIFILSYIFIFLTIFNNNYFFNSNDAYFNFLENVIFFEYPMSVWLFAVFISIFAYYFVKNEIPSKRNYVILLIITFFLGFTVELINFPVFIFLFITGIYLIVKLKRVSQNIDKEVLKNNIIKISFVYVIYTFSLFLYYVRGNDHQVDYNENFNTYLVNNLIPFCKIYFNIIIKNCSIIVIPIIVSFVINCFISKKKEQNTRLFICITSIIIGYLTFFAGLFFAGITDNQCFWIELDKLHCYYKLALLFCLILLIGYITDNFNCSKKISDITKAIICIFILLIFHKSYITEYKLRLDNFKEENRLIREMVYQAEKTAVTKKTDTLILPSAFENETFIIWWESDTAGFRWYIKNLYPEIDIKEIRYSDENNNLVDLTKQEKSELKFKKLMDIYNKNY